MARGPEAVIVAGIFAGLSTIFVSARLIARLVILKRPGAEDLLITLALVSSIAVSVLIGVQLRNGLGTHIQDIKDLEKIPRMIHQLWGSIIAYNLGLMLVKVSILVQYLRFFIHRGYRRFCWVLIAFVSMYGTAAVLVNIFSCHPIPRFWDRTVPGKCIDLLPVWFSNASWTILTDIILCILPIPMLKALQLPNRQRNMLIAIFMLGGFGCITSVLRLHSLYIATKFADISYNNAGAAEWSAIELNVGIMCACLPTLRPIVSLIFPGLMPTSRRRTFIVSYHGNSYAVKTATARTPATTTIAAAASADVEKGRAVTKITKPNANEKGNVNDSLRELGLDAEPVESHNTGLEDRMPRRPDAAHTFQP